MSKGGPAGYVEYRLKVSTAAVADLQHHVMILNSTSVSLSDLTSPLRLHRQSPSDKRPSDSRGGDDDNDDDQRTANEEHNGERDPDGDEDMLMHARSSKSGAFRRKTRILNVERIAEAERMSVDEKDAVPWILEDADAQHTFIGRLEGGQQSNYVFFVNQGREFLVVPAARWYRFNPKPAYRPLTTEEAEAQMVARGRNRAIISAQLQQTREREARAKAMSGRPSSRDVSDLLSNMEGEESAQGLSFPEEKSNRMAALRSSLLREAQIAATVGQFGQQAAATADASAAASGSARLSPVNTAAIVNLEHVDELDFAETFDDDDQGEDGEGAGLDEDDPSAPRPVVRLASRRAHQKLSAAGRDLGKLVRHLDRKVVDYRLSEDEEDVRDPYADPDDWEANHGDEYDDDRLSDTSSTRSSKSASIPAIDPARSRILADRQQLPPHLGPAISAGPAAATLPRPASLPSLTGSAAGLRTAAYNQSGTASLASVPMPRPARQPVSAAGKRKAETMLSQPPSRTTMASSLAPNLAPAPSGHHVAPPAPSAGPPVAPPSQSSSVISQDDIVAPLRKGPMRTKDLIGLLRERLKDQTNKDAFKEIIKRVAMVRAGTLEDEKWLELRPEYR